MRWTHGIKAKKKNAKLLKGIKSTSINDSNWFNVRVHKTFPMALKSVRCENWHKNANDRYLLWEIAKSYRFIMELSVFFFLTRLTSSHRQCVCYLPDRKLEHFCMWSTGTVISLKLTWHFLRSMFQAFGHFLVISLHFKWHVRYYLSIWLKPYFLFRLSFQFYIDTLWLETDELVVFVLFFLTRSVSLFRLGFNLLSLSFRFFFRIDKWFDR